MIFKLAEAAEKSWRRLNGHNQIAENHPRYKVHRRNRGCQIASSSRRRLTPFRHQDSAIALLQKMREAQMVTKTKPNCAAFTSSDALLFDYIRKIELRLVRLERYVTVPKSRRQGAVFLRRRAALL
jgi:hypothetical protein